MLCRAPDVSDQRCLRCSPKLCAWIFPLREVTRRRGHTTSRAIERGPAESWCHRRVRQCHTCATHTLKNGAGRSRGVAPVAVARERAGHLRGGEEHARSERGRAARRHRVPRRARATAAARCSAIAPEPHSRAPGERLPRHAQRHRAPRTPQKVTVQSSETSHVAVLLSAPWQSVRPRLGLWLRLAESTHHHDRSVTPSPPAPNPGSRAFLPEARRATLQAARSSAVQAPRRRSARPLQGARRAALTHARSAKNEYGAYESMLRVDSGCRCGARAGRRRAPRALKFQKAIKCTAAPLRAREHQGLACSAARSVGQRGFAPRR